jgi:putative Mg2+ transporter-C (MgtC) family protein
MLTTDALEMVLRLVVALLAGAMIGYERSYHGRPAGFRTHTLVCTASSLLMLITVYEAHWVVRVTTDSVRLDPTRMAQGIMTGIGFLGAGVIVKEGHFVRGLTTAASIWITAALGILAGVGFYFPLAISVILTLGTLSLFRRIEARVATQIFYHFEMRFVRNEIMSEDALRTLIKDHGFSIANFGYSLDGLGRMRRYNMTLRTMDRNNASRLADTLEAMERVHEFRIAPTGD